MSTPVAYVRGTVTRIATQTHAAYPTWLISRPLAAAHRGCGIAPPAAPRPGPCTSCRAASTKADPTDAMKIHEGETLGAMMILEDVTVEVGPNELIRWAMGGTTERMASRGRRHEDERRLILPYLPSFKHTYRIHIN